MVSLLNFLTSYDEAKLIPNLFPALQPAAASPQSRISDRAAQEPALPLQHLRKGVRDRVLPQDPRRKGNQKSML